MSNEWCLRKIEARKWSTFGTKQTWWMLHRDNGVSICGPCTCPHSKGSCAWSSQYWARRSAQTPFPAGRARWIQDLPHSALSSQCSLQRLAPRLVSTRHALAQPAMTSTDSSFGKASSVKSKRYPGLPLLTPSAMVSRSTTDFLLPLQPVTSMSLCQIIPLRPRRALRQSRGASVSSCFRLCVEDVRYQALQQEASRHLARASTRGGVTSQLHASLNFLIDTRLRSWCEVVTRSQKAVHG